MALPTTITGGLFSTIKFVTKGSDSLPTTQATHATAIGSSGFFSSPTEISNIREFPTFGAPANIVNVPRYGNQVSAQISGQSDAPTFELTVNYVPGASEWTTIQAALTAGTELIIQLDVKGSSTGNNAAFYVEGKVASISYSTNISESSQAVITFSTTTGYNGPFPDTTS